jgi:parallel beta-helix repeat protein
VLPPRLNVISGNLIGADRNRADRLPSGGPGVLLESQRNTLERNTIWYNGGQGVRVEGAAAVSNLLTENSIHANGKGGIVRAGGPAGGLAAPWIDRSWHEGKTKLPGRTVPGGTVEVFVDPPLTGGEDGFWGQGKTSSTSLKRSFPSMSRASPAIPTPGFLECGPDPTPDDLGCEGPSGC